MIRPRTPRRRPFWYLGRTPQSVAREVDEELNAHIDMRVEELRAAGWSSEDARREALRQFGDLEETRRYCREQDRRKETTVSVRLMIEDFVQDLRISLRGLARAPVMAAVIVATVGLGIGATTSVFSAIDAALLRPLPYSEPDRLVRIYTDARPYKFSLSVADYLALKEQQTTFAKIAASIGRTMTFADGSGAERIRGREVTAGYFDLLGIQPASGRTFGERDEVIGAPQSVIVSHGFWQRRLGGRADAIGQPVRLDGTDYTLIGVLPVEVGPLERSQDFFVPARMQPPRRKGPFFTTVLGRLRQPGDAGPAAEELRAINKRIFPIWRASYQDDRATWSMMPLKTYVVGDVSTIAGLSLAAVGLVWLVACANASNLLVARVSSRRRELAVRTALGASRGRVVRHLLAESAVLALGAAATGAALTWAGIRLLRDAGSAYFPRTHEIGFDATVLWMLAGLTLSSALMLGLIPAIQGSSGPVDTALRSEGRSATAGRGVRRTRRLLVGLQFAIATPLLIVASLLMVSVRELGRVELGFDTTNVLTGSIQLPPTGYADAGRAAGFWEDLRRRVAALPGVSGVAFADGRPPDNVDNYNNFDLEAAPAAAGQSQPVTPWVAVSPDYFRVLGVTLLEGRLLDDRDARSDDLLAVVVDRAWARRFFPNGSAVGRRLRSGGCTSCPWTTVVGVVSDVKYAGLDQPNEGAVYSPLPPGERFADIILRTHGDASASIPSLRQILRDLDPTLPLSSVATIDDLVAQSLNRPKSLSMLIASLAAVALLLAIIGIYGVMAYYVQQQAKEIGIRMALGGTRAGVLRLVIGSGMKVVVGGVAVGALAALYLTRFTSSLLFGVGARDPLAFVGVCGVLLAAALAGCLVPARRATSVAPGAILRE